MTEQDNKLLKVYRLLNYRVINDLYFLDCIHCAFGDVSDDEMIKLKNVLYDLWLSDEAEISIARISDYLKMLMDQNELNVSDLENYERHQLMTMLYGIGLTEVC